jgi:hypothetical protein
MTEGVPGIDWLSDIQGMGVDESFGGTSIHGNHWPASDEYPNVVGAYLKEGKSLIVSRVKTRD